MIGSWSETKPAAFSARLSVSATGFAMPYGSVAPGKTWPPFVVPISGLTNWSTSNADETRPYGLAELGGKSKESNDQPLSPVGGRSIHRQRKSRRTRRTRLLRGSPLGRTTATFGFLNGERARPMALEEPWK
jgi:hypothetical protein